MQTRRGLHEPLFPSPRYCGFTILDLALRCGGRCSQDPRTTALTSVIASLKNSAIDTFLVLPISHLIPFRRQALDAVRMRRDDIFLYVSPSDRAMLEAWVQDRNSPAKWIWRAKIVLATVEGLGTNAITRRTGKSEPCVWRWQERYLDEGVEGLARDKTRPPGNAPLADEVRRADLTKTACETPKSATHWSRANMARAIGISASSVGRIWAEATSNAQLQTVE